MSMNGIRSIGVLAILSALPAAIARSDTTAPTTEAAMEPAIAAVASANNAFALDLYAQLRETDGNLFFSPYSIDQALMMVRAGAGGATADEMNKTLKLPDLPPEQMSAAMAGLAQRYNANGASKGYELNVANAMWGQVGTTFLQGYIDQLRMDFGAEANWVDYRQAREAAQTINDWVEAKTHDRITHLIDAGAINDLTKLILTNAIYFKGTWDQPFSTAATHKLPWNDGTSPGSETTTQPANQSLKIVPMMYQRGRFDYAKEDGLAALQMSYVGGDLAMLVLLPDDPAGLSDLEKSFDGNRLAEIVGKLHREHEVRLSFPKFKMEASYELSKPLAKMGMATAFTGSADFSGMDGKHDLYISGVIHKAFVKVDETGTEAAAATGTLMRAAAAMRRSVVFTADHPFLFLILDVKTGTILFAGRVVDPGQ